MNSLRWKLQLQMFLYSRCCHWFEIGLRCLKMKKWLYFITLQCADLSCYKLETYWNLEKQFPCGERKSFIPVSNHTIKIYFYIFTILYYVKKYRISENTSFFSCAFYAVSKRKASSSFKPEGFSVPGGLSFVMFKHRFNTSTYHFLYGWVRLSWVTWSKTVADFGSKCRNRSEWGTLAKTGVQDFSYFG